MNWLWKPVQKLLRKEAPDGWLKTGGCTSAEKRMYLVDAQPAVVKIPKKAPGEKLLLKEIVKQNKNGCRKLTEG